MANTTQTTRIHFLLRLTPSIHTAVKARASENMRSVNAEISFQLKAFDRSSSTLDSTQLQDEQLLLIAFRTLDPDRRRHALSWLQSIAKAT